MHKTPKSFIDKCRKLVDPTDTIWRVEKTGGDLVIKLSHAEASEPTICLLKALLVNVRILV